MAPDDIVGTDTWTEQILAAIKGSTAMLVLISAASNKSPHVSREVNLALGHSRSVLPIRIENVPPGGSLEYLLSLVQRLDAFPPPISNHKDRILRRVATILAPAHPAAAAPLAAAQPPTAPVPPPPIAVPEPAPPPPITTPVTSTGPVAGSAAARLSNRTLAIGGGVIGVLIIALLGANLLLKPGATPGPTQAAVVTAAPTERPVTEPPATDASVTEPPTAAPESVDPSDFPNTAESQLIALQPSPLVDSSTCTRFTLERPTALATIACVSKPNEQWRVVFTLFPDKPSLDEAYQAWMDSIPVAVTTTHCWDYVQSNSGWYFTGTEDTIRGQLGCYPHTEGAYKGIQMVWTYDDALILGYWLSTDFENPYNYFKDWVSGVNDILY